jgi:hypothetical protein
MNAEISLEMGWFLVQVMVGDMPLRILCVMSNRNVIQFLQSLYLLLLVNIY